MNYAQTLMIDELHSNILMIDELHINIKVWWIEHKHKSSINYPQTLMIDKLNTNTMINKFHTNINLWSLNTNDLGITHKQ